MSTRRAQRAVVNRRAHHQRRLAVATTDRARLRAACAWLVAEAVRAGRAAEATRAVLEVVAALLPDAAPAAAREFRGEPQPLPCPAQEPLIPVPTCACGPRAPARAR